VNELKWMDDAACVGKGDLFFDDLAKTKVREARKICAECSVLRQCRAYAIPRDEFGVWGGLTANQRLKIRRGHVKLEDVVL
jgi:WhiB family redox-sensing transcriptional regulator